MANDDPNHEALLEAMSQLRHDLGKYLRLPFGLLPRDADVTEVRQALEDALLATRRAPGGNTSAAELWRGFVAEHRSSLGATRGYAALEAAVTTALAWQSALDRSAPLDRPRIERDMAAVGRAIEALVEEVDA